MRTLEIAFLCALVAGTLLARAVFGQTLVPEDYAVDVAVSSAWTTSSAYVSAGDTLFIYARGTVGRGGGAGDWRDWHGPAGARPDAPGGCVDCPVPGYPEGALVARIGSGGAFYVGPFAAFVSQSNGVLHLGVNDNTPEDNVGALHASVWRRGDTPTAIAEDGPPAAGNLFLYQNVPNPFNPTTSIRYRLPSSTWVVLEIFDVHGRRVATLVNGKQPAGETAVAWEGRDDRGVGVASGVYFYRMRASGQTLTRKMILLR